LPDLIRLFQQIACSDVEEMCGQNLLINHLFMYDKALKVLPVIIFICEIALKAIEAQKRSGKDA